MNLNQSLKTTTKPKRRVGRGYGSTKGGHTSGRGSKGQKARSSNAVWFEGGQLPFIRRFPFQRGKNRFKSLQAYTLGLNVSQLNNFSAGSVISTKTLLEAGLITQRTAKECKIKILGDGELSVALQVQLPTTKQAEAKIVKAGGKVDRGQDSQTT